jgi:hypothetical protein
MSALSTSVSDTKPIRKEIRKVDGNLAGAIETFFMRRQVDDVVIEMRLRRR